MMQRYIKIHKNKKKEHFFEKKYTKNTKTMTETILKAVREELRRRKITNKMAAEMLGISPQGVSNQLAGVRGFTRRTAEQWAAAFGFSEEFLMFGRGTLVPQTQEQTAAPTNSQDGVFIPSETLQMYNDMAASIRNLTELLGGVGLLKGDADFFTGAQKRR